MSDKNIVEIDIDSPQHRVVQFFPLDRLLEGRVDFYRRENAQEIQRKNELGCPQVLPGRRVGVDLDMKQGYLVELMYRDEAAKKWYDANREKLNLGSLPPQVETFDEIFVDCWLYWMDRLVTEHKAILVTGDFPKVFTYKPPFNFWGPKPKPIAQKVQESFTDDPSFAVSWVKLSPTQKEQVLAGSI